MSVSSSPFLQLTNADSQIVLGSNSGVKTTISCAAPAAAVTLSIADGGVDQSIALARKERVSTATNVTRAIAVTESNKMQLVSAAAARIFTLPSLATAAGCNFLFLIAVGGANTVTITAPSAIMQGVVSLGAAGAATNVVALNQTSLVFAASQSLGAWAEFHCDGTNYYVRGNSGIAAGFTTA